MTIPHEEIADALKARRAWAKTATVKELRASLAESNPVESPGEYYSKPKRSRRKKGNGKGKEASQRRAIHLAHKKGP